MQCSTHLVLQAHGSSSSSSIMLSNIPLLVLATVSPSLAVRDQRSLVNTFPFNAQDGDHDHQHGAHHDHEHHQEAGVSLDNRGARQVTSRSLYLNIYILYHKMSRSFYDNSIENLNTNHQLFGINIYKFKIQILPKSFCQLPKRISDIFSQIYISILHQ